MMTFTGLPVSLRPSSVVIASSDTHLIYPASEKLHFILEEFESGDTHTLSATGATSLVKFVIGRHSVALLTDSSVLFWNLADGSPLESWNAKVQDVYTQYGVWHLVGPNITFDPEIQDSRKADIDPPPAISYKSKPVRVGKLLHVGDKAFDIGPISTIAVVKEYIVTAFEDKVTILFDLKEVGSCKVDEQVKALTAAFVDDSLEVYYVSPTKVAQITAELDFNDISPVEDNDTESVNVLLSGHFSSDDQQQQSDGSTPSSSSSQSYDDTSSQHLLSLLHKTPGPPRPPSTQSLPGVGRDSESRPITINEESLSEQERASMTPRSYPSTPPANRARPKSDVHDGYVPRQLFDSTVLALKQEIIALQERIRELEPKTSESQTILPPVAKFDATASTNGSRGEPSAKTAPKPHPTQEPASIADAVTRTTQGDRPLAYLEKNLKELSAYLAGAPVKRAQLMRLILIDAYHNTKVSKQMIEDFGPSVVDQALYAKIMAGEK